MSPSVWYVSLVRLPCLARSISFQPVYCVRENVMCIYYMEVLPGNGYADERIFA